MGRRLRWLAGSALAIWLLNATGSVDQAQQNGLTFWTIETEPQRVEVQEGLGRRFQSQTGIPVDIVPVRDSRLDERMRAAVRAGDPPDVVTTTLPLVLDWYEEGMRDAEAASDVVNDLGEGSFSRGPIGLVQVEAGFAAVPSDAWLQLIVYRGDLFEANGLGPPSSWNALRTAAEGLHSPPEFWAIELSTTTEFPYMGRLFEEFTISNDCDLIGPQGQVDFTAPECVRTIEFYQELVADFTPPGAIHWQQTREDYFGGVTGIILWDSFLIDELAGLRDSVPVTVDFAEGTPALHERTDFASTLQGPDADAPAQWGEVRCLAIPTGARAAARPWVEFLMDGDAHLDWLSIAPEAKLPVRPRFRNGWKSLEIGVDRKAEIGHLYPEERIDRMLSGVDHITRWGFSKGFGGCVGEIYETMAPFDALLRYIRGEIATARQAARHMTEATRALEGCP